MKNYDIRNKLTNFTQNLISMSEKIEINDIINDDLNFNLGTEQGDELLKKSIDELGFGRSILLDKNNRVIAGNKSFEAAKDKLKKIRVIETTGDQLVAVKRTDIDLDSQKGRELALADNSISLTNLKWDKEAIDKASDEFGLEREEWGVKKDVEWVDGITAENYTPLVVCPNCFLEFSLIRDEEDN